MGHADVIDYRDYQYKPQEAENKYYLVRWASLYFGRNRYSVENDQTAQLYFLNSDVQHTGIRQEQQDKTIPAFQHDATLPYVDIDIRSIVLDDLDRVLLIGDTRQHQRHLPAWLLVERQRHLRPLQTGGADRVLADADLPYLVTEKFSRSTCIQQGQQCDTFSLWVASTRYLRWSTPHYARHPQQPCAEQNEG